MGAWEGAPEGLMKKTIAALVELQQVDDEVRVHDVQRRDLAANLERLHAILSRMEGELDDKREKLGEAVAFHKDKAGELQADADRLTRAKQKLAGVTRTKEYAAMQRELDNLRKQYSDNEAELTRLAEAIAEYEASIKAQEAKLKDLRSEVAREEATSGDRVRELETTIAKISERKKEISKDLKPQLVKRYERVLQRRDGKAVVAVEDGQCTGCRMRLPPQLYIRVQRGETLETCPTCQRYLYIEEYPEANYAAE